MLKLEVTPQITPEGAIFMDVKVNKDTRGAETLSGPAIDTKNVQTQVLVENGGTVVLGGIYEQTDRRQVTKVPWLGDIPYVGWLFKNESRIIERCLDSVKDICDYMTICDTGSTDGTQEIVKAYFEKHNIGTRNVFSGNLLRHPGYLHLQKNVKGGMKNADTIMEQAFWLGVWPGIDNQRLQYIKKILDTFMKKYI